jgi:hypothetical protein
MGLAITTTFALCLWVVLWALGIKGFDGILLSIVIVLVAATLKSLMRFLPSTGRG